VDIDTIAESSCDNSRFSPLVTADLLKAMPPFPSLLLHSRADLRETATAPRVSPPASCHPLTQRRGWHGQLQAFLTPGKHQGKKPLPGDGDKPPGSDDVSSCYSYIHLPYYKIISQEKEGLGRINSCFPSPNLKEQQNLAPSLIFRAASLPSPFSQLLTSKNLLKMIW